MIHQRNAIGGAHPRQPGAQRLPIGHADEIGLEANFAVGQPHFGEGPGQSFDRRLGVAFIDVEMLDKGITLRQILGDRVDDDARLALAGPDQVDAARQVREIEMARQGAGVGEAGEIGEIDAGARDDGIQALRVHLPLQSSDLHKILGGGFHRSFSLIWRTAS